MSKRKMTEELAAQIERESADDDLWKQEPTEIESRPSRTSVLSLRLPTGEFHALLRAARSVNETLSDYVRKAISLRQRYEQSAPTINSTYMETIDGTVKMERLEWRSTTAAPPEAKPTRTIVYSAQ